MDNDTDNKKCSVCGFACLYIDNEYMTQNPWALKLMAHMLNFQHLSIHPLICVALVTILCFSLCSHVLWNMSVSDCLKMSCCSISFSYIFIKCFICSISFHTSSVTVAKPLCSPFSVMSYHTLIVRSENVFSEEILF